MAKKLRGTETLSSKSAKGITKLDFRGSKDSQSS